jgi:acyl-CoA reductase-like NAD-dependent aldehyde dehydrogenase
MTENIHIQPMLINGQWVNSIDDEWINVENPSTKTIFAKVPRAKAKDVDLAVTAAKQASHSWKRSSAIERGKALFAIADGLEANKEKIACLISTENGNALRTQSRGEAAITVDIFRYVAGLARELKGKTVYLNPENLDYTRREPYGVVGAIVPWNAPLMLAALKIAPAIMTGNTMVLKASEEAPLAVLEMARICAEFLPPGVLNVLTGYGAECGAPIAEHPDIPKISFTGSTAVGKSILAAASQRIASVSLELGGKSAQIILPDVDHNFTADGVITAMRFTRQGQSCTAGSRLFLHESIADSFLATLTDKLKKLRVGDPLSEQTDTGALVNAKQFNRVSSYVQEAMETHPNSLILGGLPPTSGPLSNGYFFEPTVFFNLPDASRLATEEVFGPVLSVSTWRDEAEVIERANQLQYGLAAFVWGKAGAPAIRLAHALEAGWILVNQGGGQQLGQSYGGMKQSGSGREFSLEGMIESYTEIKQVSIHLRDHA